MKAFPHLFAKLFCQPVMLKESVRYSLESGLLRHMGLDHQGSEPVIVGAGNAAPQASTSPMRNKEWRMARTLEKYGNVAVIHLNGVLDKHISDFDMSCYGGFDIADFDEAVAEAAADPKVEQVVLDINSPGGSVVGIAESAARVAQLTKSKEVHAFVDCEACSAAYYIASQADHIAAAPTSIIGSIGVYLAIMDQSRRLEMEGYKVELIKAGKFKTMGSSIRPMTDEEREMFQGLVDGMHADFRAAVKSGRRGPTERGGHQTVSDAAMEGQWFFGKDAIGARLVDELTGKNLDEYVAGLL